MIERVQAIIHEVGNLSGVGAEDDFYAAGFSSVRALELLVALETAFEVTIPDEKFITARTPKALVEMLTTLQG